MKMKEVVSQTGLPEKTIRYYESRGLVCPKIEYRNGRNYHEFSESDVAELKQILILRNSDFAISEILQMKADPNSISKILRSYKERQKENAKRFKVLSEMDIITPCASLSELAQQFESIPYKSEQAAYVPELRFGLYDEESEDEKAEAIRKYRGKKSRSLSHWMNVLLGALCILLLCTNIFLLSEKNNAIPCATGSTENYYYYIAGDHLMRCEKDGSDAVIVYTKTDSHNDLCFVVAEDKIYLLDDTKLYSINYDGSGSHRFDGTFANIIPGSNSDTWPAIFLYEDKVFACYSKGGGLGSPQQKMVSISTQTGEISVIPSTFTSVTFGVYDNILYIFDTYAPTTGLEIIDLTTNKHILCQETDFEGSPLWFYNGCGYFTTKKNSTSYLYSITSETPNGLIVDSCNGSYYGGFAENCIYSETVAYVKNMTTEKEERISIHDHISVNEQAIISSNENKIEIVHLPIA